MSEIDFDFLFKILLVGNSGVGKSALMTRFTEQRFEETYASTIGVDYAVRTLQMDGKTCKLQIWDTAGQERFRTITSSYYRGSHAVIVAYSVSDLESFYAVSSWLEEVKRFANPNILVMLVATKSDLHRSRVVSFEQGRELAERFNIASFVETSAKNNIDVNRAFEQLVRETYAANVVVQMNPAMASSSSSIRIRGSGEDLSENTRFGRCAC